MHTGLQDGWQIDLKSCFSYFLQLLLYLPARDGQMAAMAEGMLIIFLKWTYWKHIHYIGSFKTSISRIPHFWRIIRSWCLFVFLYISVLSSVVHSPSLALFSLVLGKCFRSLVISSLLVGKYLTFLVGWWCPHRCSCSQLHIQSWHWCQLHFFHLNSWIVKLRLIQL